jgi:hypothetical protein
MRHTRPGNYLRAANNDDEDQLAITMPRWQGWRSSLAAAIVLLLLAAAFIAGTAVVALLSRFMPALGQ